MRFRAGSSMGTLSCPSSMMRISLRRGSMLELGKRKIWSVAGEQATVFLLCIIDYLETLGMWSTQTTIV